MSDAFKRATDRLRYALNETPSVDLKLYDVDFLLQPDAPQP